MRLGVNGGAHSLAPGEYEEDELDHKLKKERSVKPKLLRGNPKRVREYFFALQQRRRGVKSLYTSGVMTWTERLELVAPHQKVIIPEFEEMVFGDVDPCRFGRLYYEHMDKGHPEVHWSFLNQDLRSGKLVPLYYGPRDRLLFTLWQERVNLRYGFTSPLDPHRRRLFKVSHKSPLARDPEQFAAIRKQIEALFELVPASRHETCARLAGAGFEILERRQHSIIIKASNGIIHVGGAVCHAGFTGPEYIREVTAGWDRTYKEHFGTPEVIERRYRELLALRARWLERFLAKHRSRFGIEMPTIDFLTLRTEDAGAIHSLPDQQTYENNESTNVGTSPEILEGANGCLLELRAQAQRLGEPHQGLGGRASEPAGANQPTGVPQSNSGATSDDLAYAGIFLAIGRRGRQAARRLDGPDAPNRGDGQAAGATANVAGAIADLEKLHRRIVRCNFGARFALFERDRFKRERELKAQRDGKHAEQESVVSHSGGAAAKARLNESGPERDPTATGAPPPLSEID